MGSWPKLDQSETLLGLFLQELPPLNGGPLVAIMPAGSKGWKRRRTRRSPDASWEPPHPARPETHAWAHLWHTPQGFLSAYACLSYASVTSNPRESWVIRVWRAARVRGQVCLEQRVSGWNGTTHPKKRPNNSPTERSKTSFARIWGPGCSPLWLTSALKESWNADTFTPPCSWWFLTFLC